VEGREVGSGYLDDVAGDWKCCIVLVIYDFGTHSRMDGRTLTLDWFR